jgi:hypothetical protein
MNIVLKHKRTRYYFPGIGLLLLIITLSSLEAEPRYNRVMKILKQGGESAENGFYACLISGMAQRLPINQVTDECASQLTGPNEGKPGGGKMSGPGGISLPNGGNAFDPASVQANCAGGDPKRGQTYSKDPVRYPAGAALPGRSADSWGYGTYGGKGQSSEDGLYRGLSREESIREKALAILLAEAAAHRAVEILEKVNATADPAEKARPEKELDEALQEAEKASDTAKKDPNIAIPVSRPSREPSACDIALQKARQLLYECNRTGWKTQECQSLNAKMHGCPNPARIFVDPERGYQCGASVPDAKALKDAWVKRCQSRVKYGPGDNPCQPPELYGGGRYIRGDSRDICSDPRAIVDPESGICSMTLKIPSFGKKDIQQIIVVALDKIGGPIVVLPDNTPAPSPRPSPGPEPHPGRPD